MSEEQTTAAETAEPTMTTEAPTPDLQAQVEELTRKLDEFKSHSRTWEQRAKENKSAADKLRELEQQNMSDLEKAVAKAREEATAEVRRETGTSLAQAEFKVAAANSGVDLSEVMDVVDVARFVTEDGKADADAISDVVQRFAKLAKPSKFGEVDLGPRNGNKPNQLTRDDLKKMKPAEILKAESDGRLVDLMGGSR